jgi:hypothetical protein
MAFRSPVFSYNKEVSIYGWKIGLAEGLSGFFSFKKNNQEKKRLEEIRKCASEDDFLLHCENLVEDELKFQALISPNGSFVFFQDSYSPYLYFGVLKDYLYTEKDFGQTDEIKKFLDEIKLSKIPPKVYTFTNC